MDIRDRDPFRLTHQEEAIMRALDMGATRADLCAAFNKTPIVMNQRLRMIRQKFGVDTDGEALKAWRAKQQRS